MNKAKAKTHPCFYSLVKHRDLVARYNKYYIHVYTDINT